MNPQQQPPLQQQGQQQPFPTTPVAAPLSFQHSPQGFYPQPPPPYGYTYVYPPAQPQYGYNPNYVFAPPPGPHMSHMQHNPQQAMSPNIPPLPASPGVAGKPPVKRKPLLIVNPKTKEAVLPQSPAPPAVAPAPVPVAAPQPEVVAPSPKTGPSPASKMLAKALEAKSKPSLAIKSARSKPSTAVLQAAPASAPSSRKPAKICLSRETILKYRECAVALSELEHWPEDRYGFPAVLVRARNFSTTKSAPPRVGAAPVSFMDDPLKPLQSVRTQPTEALNEALFTVLDEALQRLKTTKDNAAALTEQVFRICVISKGVLETVMYKIFSQALREPRYNSVYAQLCKDINERSAGGWPFLGTVERDGQWFWTSTTEVDDDDSALEGPVGKYEPGAEGFPSKQAALDAAKKQTAFKRMLLNHCQTEFENNSLEAVNKLLKQVELQDGLEGDAKLRCIAELESLRKMTKLRVLGNIAFIGELFLKKMLSGRIINMCVHHLLEEVLDSSVELRHGSVQPEDIECLVQLFTKVGKEMDSPETGRDCLNQCFSLFARVEKAEALPPRYNAMLLDLLKLRQNNWHVETLSTKEDILAQANNEQFNRSNPRSHGDGGGNGARPRDNNSSNGNSLQQQSQPSARFARNATPIALSPAETKKKVDFIFKEFASDGDAAYVVDEVKLYYSPELAQLVAQTWFDAFLSKGDVKLLALLSALSTVAGGEVVELMLDMVVTSCARLADVKIDVPKAPTNLAHIFKHCLDSGLWTNAVVKQVLSDVVAQWKSADDEFAAASNADSAESLRTTMEAVLASDKWSKLLTL